MIGNSNDETSFPHKSLLTARQVANLRKAFAKKQSTDIIGWLLGLLLKAGLLSMKNVIKPLAKSVLIPLWSTAKSFGLWNNSTNNIKWWNEKHYEKS